MKMDLKSAIEQYLIDQEIKGSTKATIRYYKNGLKYFAEYIGWDKQVSEITLQDLKQYLLTVKSRPKLQNHPYKPTVEKPISSVSVQTYMKSLRAFLGWLFNEGYIAENLEERFKLPKAMKKVIEILSDEEIDKVMKAYKPTSELGLRNLCLLALMLDCGLRRNEALELCYDNVHMTQGVIKVSGKGQKERIVPLGLYTKKLLLKYMNGYRPTPAYETKILLLDKGSKPMTENAVKQLFARLRKRLGIERLHPHILRHTFATKYLMNGGDIFTLQQILGHTSLEMVRRYSHLASSYVIEKAKKYSPLDVIEKNKFNKRVAEG